ncbi:MAG: ABC transporter ATP-binding protein [Erysipelotrichaceae bacterium]
MLTLENITLNYGNKRGINQISFQVRKGEILGILGSNGSGKTTTFRVLLGLLQQQKGEIRYNGEEISATSRLFGYLPEERSLLRDMKVEEHVWYFAQLKKLKHKDFLVAFTRWASYFNLLEYRKHKVGTLSKGNQQKVQLLCAIIHDPAIYIFDEPFSGLDFQNQELFQNLILQLKAEHKIILLSTHTLYHFEQYCDCLLVLQDGEVRLFETMDALRSQQELCLVLPHKEAPYPKIEALSQSSWQDGLSIWYQLEPTQLETAIKALLTEQIFEYQLSKPPMEKLIRGYVHA